MVYQNKKANSIPDERTVIYLYCRNSHGHLIFDHAILTTTAWLLKARATIVLVICVIGLLPQKSYGIFAWFGKEIEAE